ncbi:NADP-dependent aldehyde dehydrogenase [Allocatelliglobosispora scoriae]|uniref:NADP-dependent aldehyde dehydrogenase n=1 Tax=Allocatelliglobosispora scoriae TaxID=643052 RepID=A0A841BTG2_9ACTN|nr:aldehyde dehydrogenase family protein [Allocatelliglobosispora scoriae]MBB5870706.1 NADP-dependent aldehyde dehydrogenase [Allocatelliglobosispora scoriae]
MIPALVSAAVEAAPVLASWTGAQRRDALHAVADALAGAADEIIKVVTEETGLTVARVTGELDRTTGQLRLLGDFVAAGRHRTGRSSPGAGLGGADITQVVVPLGPVAVFAASNFPLAFGVCGGDTAAALAAGCPVIVKAHPAQPVTSQLIASLIEPVLPAGFFALADGDIASGIELVTSPGIKAVGFTGSFRGGKALIDAVNTRPDPIPVFAEMGSINPVFVLPGAAAELDRVAALAAAVTGSCGQLCTKPGLIVVPRSDEGDIFAGELATAVGRVEVHRMLTEGMAAAHAEWIRTAADKVGIEIIVGSGSPSPVAVITPVAEPDLLEEHFGPSVVVLSIPVESFLKFAGSLEGQLTATVQAGADDHELAASLLPVLAGKAGRIVWNAVPTGVAVCDAMLHGGPWPATSASASTSVGTAAIERFQRPVALQGVPEELTLVFGG